MDSFGNVVFHVFMIGMLLLFAYWVYHSHKSAGPVTRYTENKRCIQQPQDALEDSTSGREIPAENLLNSLEFISRQSRMLLLNVDRRRCISESSGNPLVVSPQAQQDVRELSRILCNLMTSLYGSMPSDGAANCPIEHDHLEPTTNNSLNHCFENRSLNEDNQIAQDSNEEGEERIATLREAGESLQSNNTNENNEQGLVVLTPQDVTIRTEGVSDSVTVVSANQVDGDSFSSAQPRGSGSGNSDAQGSSSAGISDGRMNPSMVGAVPIDGAACSNREDETSRSGKEPTCAKGDEEGTRRRTPVHERSDVGPAEQLLRPDRNDGIGDGLG